jgi:hypothetical protein
MSTAPATTTSHQESTTERLRNLLIGASFAFALLLRRILEVRRYPGYWLGFRILLGVAGAALVVVPLSLLNSWLTAPAGLAIFLAAILLAPAKPSTKPHDKMRELGAFIVVNGGVYQSDQARPAPVQLYVGADRISVLDSRGEPLLAIPLQQIVSATSVRQPDGWDLQIVWSDQVSAFTYHGIFAERLARVAERTVRSVIPTPSPVIPRTRAASA